MRVDLGAWKNGHWPTCGAKLGQRNTHIGDKSSMCGLLSAPRTSNFGATSELARVSGSTSRCVLHGRRPIVAMCPGSRRRAHSSLLVCHPFVALTGSPTRFTRGVHVAAPIHGSAVVAAGEGALRLAGPAALQRSCDTAVRELFSRSSMGRRPLCPSHSRDVRNSVWRPHA